MRKYQEQSVLSFLYVVFCRLSAREGVICPIHSCFLRATNRGRADGRLEGKVQEKEGGSE
jgi:hypothetical protein